MAQAAPIAAPKKVAAAQAPGSVDVDSPLGRWLAVASERSLPAPDGEPLVEGKTKFPLVWRQHYAVAVIGKPNKAATERLINAGFEVIVFEGAAALGR